MVPTAIAGTEKTRNWKRFQFPKVTMHYGEALRFERVESPSREQSQAASEVIFEEIKRLHTALRADGRRSAVRAARAARQTADAAEAAGRRPVTH